TLFTPPAGETVLWAGRWEEKKKAATLAFVGTDRSIHAVDEKGSRLFSAPLAFDLGAYRLRSAGRLNDPQRSWVWFEPQGYLGVEAVEAMPAWVVFYDAAGGEVGRQSVPTQPGRPGDARVPDPRVLIFEPSYNVALSGVAASPAEFALFVGAKQFLIGQA